jgi:hypothetical protein
MEIEISLSHSQEPATCPYPEPDLPSPYSNPISWRSILILSPISTWVCQVSSFAQVSQPIPSLNLFCLSCVPHASTISFFLIWSHENIWCYVFFSTLFLLHPYMPQRSPQHPILEHLQPMFLPQCVRQGNKPNYSSAHLDVYIFIKNWKKKILRRMISSIPCLQSVLNFFMNVNWWKMIDEIITFSLYYCCKICKKINIFSLEL